MKKIYRSTINGVIFSTMLKLGFCLVSLGKDRDM
ncbi:unnamed protein product [Arabidopsis halleri]